MCRKLISLISLVLVLSLFGANVAFGDSIEIPVAVESDDAEEAPDGDIDLDSSDLEFMYDNDVTNPDDLQVVGIRFVDVQIPQGENILSAVVRFDADDVDDAEHVGEASVIIEGELSPNPGTFEDVANNISARPRTAAQVAWGPEHWSEKHAKYFTPDIAGIIQEIVNQEDWAAGNALVLIFSQDPVNASTGVLEAESFFDNATENIDRRATLIVEFGEALLVDEIKREAEDADVLGASWRTYTDRTASGAKYIGSDNGDGDDNDTAPGAEWVLTYNFEATGGDYKILARVIAPTGSDDSFWVRIPTATSQTLEDPDQPGTGWVRFNSIEGGETWLWDEVHSNDHDNEVVIWTLERGAQTLEIAKREDGTSLDGFIITNDLLLDQSTLPGTIDPPPIAIGPIPADGAVGVVEGTLEWIAAPMAVSHMVYLSTDETIDESDFLAETQMAIQFADLAPGTTYYWRVDEVEAEIPVGWDSWEIEVIGAVVNEGDVWSFTTMTVEAHNASPSDGAASVSLDAKLSWAAGKDAIMHDVYFGTDKAAVEAGDPSTFMGKLMETSFDPGPLELGTTYYWKVDEFAVIATNPGPLWSFTTKMPSASDPEPQDGEEDTVQSPVLSFSPSVKAAEHDLYLGDDADAVANADVNTPDIYLGRQAETSLDAGDLEWDKTYYWRVDEVNELAEGSPWKGAVWSFTTADFLIIDLSETVLDYDNSAEPFISEASWDTPQDLTVNGVTDLMFRFQGAPGPEGSASLDEATGTYAITGSGADVWGSSDQFHYMYRELSGDGSIIAHVVDNGTGSNNWAKGGVMIRQSLDAGSTHAIMAVTGSSGGGGAFQYRPAADGSSISAHDDNAGIAPGHWVKLERVGNAISGSYSVDGIGWTQQGDAQTIEMKDPVLIGLFVTSHAVGEKRTYTFDNVSTTGKVSAAAANQDIGIPFNSAEKLYLAVEDATGALGVVTHPDPAATQIDQWWTMKVPLLDLSDAGVDVANAAKLYIGVGDVDNPTAGGSGTIRIDNIKGVKPIVILEAADVTAPGDNVRGIPTGLPCGGDPSANYSPCGELPPLVVDNDSTTKYLNFGGNFDPNEEASGFKVTPLAGPTIVTGLTFTTANDAEERDPVAYELYGSNVSIDGPYNLIASGDIVDFNDVTAWPRFTMNATPITFDNATVYTHYQVLFPAIRDAESANSMQIAEVELIGVTEDVLVDITKPSDTIYGWPSDSDWPSSESPLKALDDNIKTNYRHKKGEIKPTGILVTPSKKKVVDRLIFTTADDAPERDPVAFEFYGSDQSITGKWTLIASGKIDDFNQETPWPRLTKNETPIMFDNDVAYKHYKLMITAVRDAGSADSMQFAEVELIEALK
ncbi:MAG: hypothetical protein ACETWQ_01975 [Phycisphaerae bacterium]